MKDVEGERLELELGLKSYSESARQRGYSPDLLIEEIKKDKEMLEAAGIQYPSSSKTVANPTL